MPAQKWDCPYSDSRLWLITTEEGQFVSLEETVGCELVADHNPRSLDVTVAHAMGPLFGDLVIALDRAGVGVQMHCRHDAHQEWRRVDRLRAG